MTHPRALIRHWLVLFILAIMVAAPMNFVVGAIHRYLEEYAIWNGGKRNGTSKWLYHIVEEHMVGGFTKDYGWPKRATRMKFPRHNSPPSYTENSLENGIAIPNIGVDGLHLRIAVLPIFPGFLINTASYAAAFLLMYAGIGRVRQSLRRRANSCPHCAYSLAGLPPNSPCPECGEARITVDRA